MSGNNFSEYRQVSITEPLRQGDVLERIDDDWTPWNRHLLVMTADCDLAHDKHHGRVTCVPLLRKDEYLLELLLPKLRDQATRKLVTALQKLLAEGGGPEISAVRLRDWPREQPTDEILSALSVPEGTQEVIAGVLDGIRDLGEAPGSVPDAASVLISAQRRLPTAQSEKNLRIEIVNRLQNAFKQPPGDALFLSAVADGHQHGYFAYLRHLEQIWEQQVATGPTRSAASAYRRLARLEDNYTHAIAQRFALVFMSIGLPDAYEEMRDLHADLLGEDIP